MAKPWSKDEFELLKKLYPYICAEDLTQRMNRPFHAINKMASRLNITKKVRKRARWPEEDIKILRKIYPATETWKVANELNRPISAVRRKAKELGLKKTPRIP